MDAALKMLNLPDLPFLVNYRNSIDEGRAHVRCEHSIAFLRGFVEQVFKKELSTTAKEFLLDGKFYKDDNRKEFMDSFNGVERLRERIMALDRALSNEGHYGARLRRIEEEGGVPASRRKAAASVFAEADSDAEAIVTDGQRDLSALQRVVDGILHGSGDDPYDTIANFNRIGGPDNGRLIAALRVGASHLAGANQILGGLLDIEVGQAKR